MAQSIVRVVFATLFGCACLQAQAQDKTEDAVFERSLARVCLSEQGKPTDRCLETSAFSMRMGVPGVNDAGKVDLAFRLDVHDLEDLAKFASSQGGEGLEICVIEGANICPPEPLEIVAVCITTSELAGYECPDVPDNADAGGVFVYLRAGPSTAEVDCVDKGIDWCKASHEVTGGPLSELIGCIVAATKECVGSLVATDALMIAD